MEKCNLHVSNELSGCFMKQNYNHPTNYKPFPSNDLQFKHQNIEKNVVYRKI